MTTEEKAPRKGCRRVPITVVFHLYEDVPEDWEDGGRFFVEENHCIDNYVTSMHRELEENPGYCMSCCRANAYLGHIPFADIVKAQDALPEQGYTPPCSTSASPPEKP